ncbi:MAG: molybdate ABC transporter substrate-binding protein [Kineosporiaceae bacterium]
MNARPAVFSRPRRPGLPRSTRRPGRRRRVGLAALAVLALGPAGCGGDTGPQAAGTAGSSAPVTITVLAAASLKEAFTAIGADVEAAEPGLRVRFSFGASPALQAQIEQGAPADVYASASPKSMDALVRAGRIDGEAVPFAANSLEIAVPPANPAGITGLADLARPGVKVAVCEASVPCGAVAAKVFAAAGLTLRPATQEADVKATLAKVQLGEVDAGLVYVTDVRAAKGKVRGIAVPAGVNASTTYPIAVVEGSPRAEAARRFVQHVLSAEGRAVLAEAGFSQP